MADRMDLVTALAPTRDAAQETSTGLTIFEMLQDETVTAQMQRVLGDQVGADRMARIIQTSLRSNPKLAGCTIPSIMGAALMCAQLNLEPGPYGHVYLIPRKNRQLGRSAGRDMHEVNFELGYLGMVELMYRHPDVKVVQADKVCEGDKFEFSTGPAGRFHHEYDPFGERGPLRGYYTYVEFHSGGWRAHPMTEQQIHDGHRARSEAFKSAEKSWGGNNPKRDSPWHTDNESMCLKTTTRMLFKFIPKAPGVAQAVGADQAVIDVDLGRYQSEGFNVTPNVEVEAGPVAELDVASGDSPVDVDVVEDVVDLDALIAAAKTAGRIPANKQRKTAAAALLPIAEELTGARFGSVDELLSAPEVEELLAKLGGEAK